MTFEEYLLGHARTASKRHQRITLDDKMAFFQQLGSLVSAGTPLLRALEVTTEQFQSERLRTILREVMGRVAAGSEFHSALAHYPRVFESHWIALIGTGEASGRMAEVLEDLNIQIREAQETKRKIGGALTYPIILLFVAIVVILVMLWFVVPTFGAMFEEMNAELPGITKFVLQISDVVVNYGLYGIGVAGVLAFFARRYLGTDRGRRRLDAVRLAIPLIGDLTVQSAMYRFSSNLALLLKSGVPMLDTLAVLAGVYRSYPSYHDALLNAQRRVAAGRSLADSLDESGLFTTMIINMVRIGEESSQLAEVMAQIAPYYKEKMNSFLNRVTKLLEPFIIIFMGITIAIVMLAIYIPMFEMSGKVN